jgi:hypothetical protein
VSVDNGEILYFKILKTARQISGINVMKDSLGRDLTIDFNALEKDDGFVGQVIFEGNKDTQLKIEGGIDSVKAFRTELESIPPIYFLVALLILIIAAYIYLLLSKRNPKSVPKLLFFFSAIPVVYLLLMLYKTEWFIHHKVPETLRIEQYVEQSRKQVFELSSWFR